MYCKCKTCLRSSMEDYEDLIQKIKDLGNAIRECGDDATPEMLGTQERLIRLITGHMTDREHNFVKWLNGEELVRTFKRRKSDDAYNEQRRKRRRIEREKKGSDT